MSKLGLDPVTMRHVPYRWLTDECAQSGTCVCGFCKPASGTCDYGDCMQHATARCPVFGYPVCARHYGANGLRHGGRIVYPRSPIAPAPCGATRSPTTRRGSHDPRAA